MTEPTPKPPLPGANIMLMGPGGTGKTHIIGDAVDAGLTVFGPDWEVFYVAIEAGLESLLGYWTEVRPGHPKPEPVPPNLHWAHLEGTKMGFKDLAEIGKKVNMFDYVNLGKMQDPDRWKYDGMIKLNELLFNFKDARTGKEFGSVDSWGPNRMIVLDGLTGISSMAMNLVVGGKPIRNPGDYGIAQGQVLPFLRLLCDHCNCWFVLISHIDREIDQVMGGNKIMPATVGQKLAPLLPPMFSDVALTKREGTTWSWSTIESGADTKARNLPWADKITPGFKQIFEAWKRKSEAGAAELLT